MSNIKQTIVIRTDLNMRKGKMIAQGAHASIAFLTRKLALDVSPTERRGRKFYGAEALLTEPQMAWIDGDFTKICLGIGSEAELLALHEAASRAGLVSHLIVDNGLTEFNGVRTPTCVAIGPDYAERIDPITKDLKLL